MITITNDKETKIVTKGAYNSFYKPLGFRLSSESTKSVKDDIKESIKETKVEKIDEEKRDEIKTSQKDTKQTYKKK